MLTVPLPHPPVPGIARAAAREVVCRTIGHTVPVPRDEVVTRPVSSQTVRPQHGATLVERIEECARCGRARVATPWLGSVWVRRR